MPRHFKVWKDTSKHSKFKHDSKEECYQKEVERGVLRREERVRLIVINLRQSETGNDRELVWDMIERMGVRVRSEDVADIIRMRKKDGDEAVNSVIIGFKSEYDKWMVRRNKADLRDMGEYKSCFRD